MEQYLRKHPIIIAVFLGILIAVITAVCSVLSGQHYYYRIYNEGDSVTDVQIQQSSNDGTPVSLVRQSSVDYTEEYTMVYFDAVQSGEGMLGISYTRKSPTGEILDITKETKLVVSGLKVIHIGEGVYNHNGISVIHFGNSLFSLLMIFYLIWRRKSIRKINRYSYEYLSTWSGQLFFTVVFMVFAITAVMSIIQLSYIDVYLMSVVGRYLMMFMTALTFPLLFLFAIAMTISNISLIRHEGKRFRNMLGILIGIGLIIMILVVLFFFTLFLSYGGDNVFIAVTYSVVNACYLVFWCVLYGAIISGVQAGQYTPATDKDYIIILGCSIRKDGTLYPLIRGRVDRAIAFAKAQEQKNGKKLVFVPSGGKGTDEIISEGEAMKRYLIEQGIPEESILAETKSATTYENMKFSRELIQTINPDAKIAFSTTNYHVMRSGILAAKSGLIAEGMGAPTKWYFWPNALLREVVGMLAYQPRTQIITMLFLAVTAGFAGYIYYLVV